MQVDRPKYIAILIVLAIVALCLFGQALVLYCGIFRECETILRSSRSAPLVGCLAVMCGFFIFLTFSLSDLLLIALLLIATASYILSETASRTNDAVFLISGIALGKAARFFLEGPRQTAKDAGRSESSQIINHGRQIYAFLSGLVLLLAFPSWCDLRMSGTYHGPRWMGLWDNPNTYGMLMATETVVAIALLVADKGWNVENGNSNGDLSPPSPPFLAGMGNPFLCSLRSIAAIDSVLLFIATGMMEVGLLFSYSRGSWLGAVVGLLYVAKSQGKFKLRFALLGIAIIGVVAGSFWNATPDDAPWYAKRLDFGRPSAQHRVAAWKAGFEMLRNHPFGLGWNKTVEVYRKNYSPPIGGAAAITTNDYLMLGTQLGFPGLICFLAYVGLCFRKFEIRSSEFNFKAACRAGALAMLVAFWFDEGLFTLATGSVFWISLELGKADSHDGGAEACFDGEAEGSSTRCN